MIPLEVDRHHRPPMTIPTVTWFSPEMRRHYGSAAVHEYLESDLAGRFIQSVKRHLPRRAFSHTLVGGQPMDLSELIAGQIGSIPEWEERASKPIPTPLRRRDLASGSRLL